MVGRGRLVGHRDLFEDVGEAGGGGDVDIGGVERRGNEESEEEGAEEGSHGPVFILAEPVGRYLGLFIRCREGNSKFEIRKSNWVARGIARFSGFFLDRIERINRMGVRRERNLWSRELLWKKLMIGSPDGENRAN
jgi:hypothetical protein